MSTESCCDTQRDGLLGRHKQMSRMPCNGENQEDAPKSVSLAADDGGETVPYRTLCQENQNSFAKRPSIRVEEIPVILSHMDNNLRYVEVFNWDKNYPQWLPQEQWIGKTDFELMPNIDGAYALFEHKHNCFRTGLVQKREVCFLNVPLYGVQAWLCMTWADTDIDGDIVGVYAACVEVTEIAEQRRHVNLLARGTVERAAALEDLERMVDVAAGALETRAACFASMAFSIQKPLDSVYRHVDELAAMSLGREQLRQVRIIRSQQSALLELARSALAEDILGGDGGIQVINKAFNPADVVLYAVRQTTAMSVWPGVTIKCEIDADTPTKAIGDPLLLLHVLQILLRHVLRSMHSGVVTVRVLAQESPQQQQQRQTRCLGAASPASAGTPRPPQSSLRSGGRQGDDGSNDNRIKMLGDEQNAAAVQGLKEEGEGVGGPMVIGAECMLGTSDLHPVRVCTVNNAGPMADCGGATMDLVAAVGAAAAAPGMNHNTPLAGPCPSGGRGVESGEEDRRNSGNVAEVWSTEPSPNYPNQPNAIPNLTQSTQACGSNSLTIPHVACGGGEGGAAHVGGRLGQPLLYHKGAAVAGCLLLNSVEGAGGVRGLEEGEGRGERVQRSGKRKLVESPGRQEQLLPCEDEQMLIVMPTPGDGSANGAGNDDVGAPHGGSSHAAAVTLGAGAVAGGDVDGDGSGRQKSIIEQHPVANHGVCTFPPPPPHLSPLAPVAGTMRVPLPELHARAGEGKGKPEEVEEPRLQEQLGGEALEDRQGGLAANGIESPEEMEEGDDDDDDDEDDEEAFTTVLSFDVGEVLPAYDDETAPVDSTSRPMRIWQRKSSPIASELRVCDHLVHLMGGRLHTWSTRGGRSRYRFSLCMVGASRRPVGSVRECYAEYASPSPFVHTLSGGGRGGGGIIPLPRSLWLRPGFEAANASVNNDNFGAEDASDGKHPGTNNNNNNNNINNYSNKNVNSNRQQQQQQQRGGSGVAGPHAHPVHGGECPDSSAAAAASALLRKKKKQKKKGMVSAPADLRLCARPESLLGPASHQSPLCVLLLEGDEDEANHLSPLLSALGLSLVVVPTVAEALDALSRSRFDMLMLEEDKMAGHNHPPSSSSAPPMVDAGAAAAAISVHSMCEAARLAHASQDPEWLPVVVIRGKLSHNIAPLVDGVDAMVTRPATMHKLQVLVQKLFGKRSMAANGEKKPRA